MPPGPLLGSAYPQGTYSLILREVASYTRNIPTQGMYLRRPLTNPSLALQLSNGTHSQQTSNKPGTSQNSRRDLSTYSNQGNVGSTTLEQSLPTPYILNFELVGQTLMTIYSL